MESLDKRLLEAILSSVEDSESQDNDAIREKSSTHLRPFHWYNYLQKERPVEFSALTELVQKLQTGKKHCKFFCTIIFTATLILLLGKTEGHVKSVSIITVRDKAADELLLALDGMVVIHPLPS